MKIAVSSTGPSLDADIDPRFGRCQHFIIVDPQTQDFEAIENTNIAASGGAGIASAQTVAGKEVEAVLTGNCGPNAYQTLSAAGIQVITGVTGTVRDAVDLYNKGQLQPDKQPSVGAHFGTGAAGKGAGSGRSTSGGTRSNARREEEAIHKAGSSATPSHKPEIQGLGDQTETLKQQVDDIQRRIDKLVKKGG